MNKTIIMMILILAAAFSVEAALPSRICYPLSTGTLCINSTSITGMTITGTIDIFAYINQGVNTTSQVSFLTANATNFYEGGQLLSSKYTSSTALLNNITSVNNNIVNNITAALLTTYFNASTVQTMIGTPQGAVGDLQTYNDVSYNVSEVTADLDIEVNFSDVTGLNQFIIRYKTIAGEAHLVNIYLYDYDDSAWESYGHLSNTNNVFEIKTIGVYDETSHISGGNVRMKLNTSNIGATTDKWQFDWITLSDGIGVPSGAEIDPNSIHRDGTIPLTANWNAGDYNITANTFWGRVNESRYPALGNDNTWTGANTFNPTTNTSFYNDALFYGEAYFLNNVTLTNTYGLAVNSSYILRNIAGTVIGNWSDESGTANFRTNGGVYATTIYENGYSMNTKYNETAAINLKANTLNPTFTANITVNSWVKMGSWVMCQNSTGHFGIVNSTYAETWCRS